MFAEEAAVEGIGPVVRVVDFGGLDDADGELMIFGELDGGNFVGSGEAGGIGEDAEDLSGDDLMGGPEEIRAVDAAGVGDEGFAAGGKD